MCFLEWVTMCVCRTHVPWSVCVCVCFLEWVNVRVHMFLWMCACVFLTDSELVWFYELWYGCPTRHQTELSALLPSTIPCCGAGSAILRTGLPLSTSKFSLMTTKFAQRSTMQFEQWYAGCHVQNKLYKVRLRGNRLLWNGFAEMSRGTAWKFIWHIKHLRSVRFVRIVERIINPALGSTVYIRKTQKTV